MVANRIRQPNNFHEVYLYGGNLEEKEAPTKQAIDIDSVVFSEYL